MKDEADRPKGEMDVLKFYIWLMLVMTLALGVLFWKFMGDLEDTRKNVALAQSLVSKDEKDSFPKLQAEVQGMLNVYRNNKEDEARDAPQTWFSNIWRRCGIPDVSMKPGAWKVPPSYDSKGKFYQEEIDMVFDAKNPLSRQAIAQFCHEVEKSSTRLRVISLEVRRAGEKDNYDQDLWSGKAVIGFRHARMD